MDHEHLGGFVVAFDGRAVHAQPSVVGPVDRPGSNTAVLVEHGWEDGERVGAGHEPKATRIFDRCRERVVSLRDLEAGSRGAEAIAEPPVDDALGGAEDRNGLAELGRV